MITLEIAIKIALATLEEGKKLKCKPLTVAVLDCGGHLKAFLRQDGASLLRPEIAFAKAWGALGMGDHSRIFSKMAEERPAFMNGLMMAAQGRVIPVAGGVLIASAENALLGAVGVTGDTSDRDEECAIAGIKAGSLTLYKAT